MKISGKEKEKEREREREKIASCLHYVATSITRKDIVIGGICVCVCVWMLQIFGEFSY